MANPKGYNVIPFEGRTIAVLYKTKIVTITADAIALNTGGWKTRHTIKCMNLALKNLGYRVFQKDFDLFCETPSGRVLEFINNEYLTINTEAA